MARIRAAKSPERNSGAGRASWIPAAKRIACVLLLLCAVVVSIRTTWIVSGNLFDSDTSSELILSEKLAREGGIMSPGWYYSTELQVIDCQIVYALLFRLTSDWFMVRFWGSVLMQLMMLGAFGFLSRQARIPFNRFCLAGAAMLLPFSVPYGRIVLYHNYYTFHMIMANLTVGLYFAVMRRMRGDHPLRRWPVWAFGGGLALVSFAAGLEGVRQLMVCTVPLLAAALLSALTAERGETEEDQNRLRASLPALLWALAPVAFSALGYWVNTRAFAGNYRYLDYSGQFVALSGIGMLENILRNFLITLGFHDQSELFSLHGLLGMGGLLIWLGSILLALHTIRHTRDAFSRFLCLFMFTTQLVMACVFMLLVLDGYRMDLYFLPATFWILPALAKADLRPEGGAEPCREQKGLSRLLRAGDAKLSSHGLISLLVLVLFLVNGAYYTAFFRDPSGFGSQIEYNGLNYNDTDNIRGMRPIAEYLTENGYTMIYASYWDAAVLTELTNGKVRSMPVEPGTRKHPIRYYDWLSDGDLRNPDNIAGAKAAVVANFDLSGSLEEGNKYGAVETVSFGGYTIFDLPNPTALAEDLK